MAAGCRERDGRHRAKIASSNQPPPTGRKPVCGPTVPLKWVGVTPAVGIRVVSAGMSGRDRLDETAGRRILTPRITVDGVQGRGCVSHLRGPRARASCARSERTPRAMSPRAGHRPLGGLNTQGVGVPPCRWLGTARLYRGMSLAQTPPRLPLTRRPPQAGLACRGSRWGLLASQGPPRGVPLPPRATGTWSTFGQRNRSMRSGGGHQRYVARRLALSPGVQTFQCA